MSDFPFWSDDFDMDLPKIFPDAKALMGDLAEVEMFTTSHPDKTGRLNSATVWNSTNNMVAFFGFNNDRRPASYYSSAPLIKCTAWEAFRDAWPHHYTMLLERKPVWNTFNLVRHFENIMTHRRGWIVDQNRHDKSMSVCRKSLLFGIASLRLIVARARR